MAIVAMVLCSFMLIIKLLALLEQFELLSKTVINQPAHLQNVATLHLIEVIATKANSAAEIF